MTADLKPAQSSTLRFPAVPEGFGTLALPGGTGRLEWTPPEEVLLLLDELLEEVLDELLLLLVLEELLPLVLEVELAPPLDDVLLEDDDDVPPELELSEPFELAEELVAEVPPEELAVEVFPEELLDVEGPEELEFSTVPPWPPVPPPLSEQADVMSRAKAPTAMAKGD